MMPPLVFHYNMVNKMMGRIHCVDLDIEMNWKSSPSNGLEINSFKYRVCHKLQERFLHFQYLLLLYLLNFFSHKRENFLFYQKLFSS